MNKYCIAKTFLYGIIVFIFWCILIGLFSCHSMHKSSTENHQVHDSTTHTQVDTFSATKKDSAGHIKVVDSTVGQSWWQSETQTTIQEKMDTTGKVRERTTTIRENANGQTKQTQTHWMDQHSQLNAGDTNHTHAAQATQVKNESGSTTTQKSRTGTSPWAVLAVVAALAILIWWKWDDLVFWIFKRKNDKR